MSTVATEVVDIGHRTIPVQQGSSLLGSRTLDFWMLGGFSILVWLPLYVFLDRIAAVRSFGLALPTLAFALAYAINHPHFMASYKLAYAQGRGFIRQNWFQLVVVPLALVSVMAVAYLRWDTPISGSSLINTVNSGLAALGLRTRLGMYLDLGSELMSYLVLFMYFTVGWHYSKQTFGCMMVYARFDQYPLSTWQRNLIRYGLLSTWWVSWLYSHCSEGSFSFYGLTVYRLNLPYVWFQASYVVVGLMFTAVVLSFVWRYRREQRLPSWNFLVPMLALLTWHVPLFGQPEFFVVIALFHSLQYFPFVAKVEYARYRRDARPHAGWRLSGFLALMAGIGYLAFYFLPQNLDTVSQAPAHLGIPFFMMAFVLLINIHHYFIDNVLWRFKNRDVRELLVR